MALNFCFSYQITYNFFYRFFIRRVLFWYILGLNKQCTSAVKVFFFSNRQNFVGFWSRQKYCQLMYLNEKFSILYLPSYACHNSWYIVFNTYSVNNWQSFLKKFYGTYEELRLSIWIRVTCAFVKSNIS
jgi:hypothetical protein